VKSNALEVDGMNVAAVAQKPVSLALSSIKLDAELQPRQRIDKETWEEYLNALTDGALFPPVMVFHDGETYWLADGFHRWHAHEAASLNEITAIVVEGSRDDALRFALGANAIHGKRREAGDYRSAYERARKHGLVDPADVAAVQALLRCTMRWATTLTEAARGDAARARDAEIAERKLAGESNRAIARDVGVDEKTVRNVTSAEKRNTSKYPHPIEPRPLSAAPLPKNPTEPVPKHPAQVEFEDMTSARGQRWGALFDALRAINALPAADALFADRYRRLDVAIGPQLTEANFRLAEIHRRFFDG
jgi:ParB-like chromosome segregation protein Spo0J